MTSTVHLTRRGRYVFLTLLVLCLLGGLLVVATTAHADRPLDFEVVVVQPGDSLWSVATRTRPDARPYPMIDEIRALNGLTGGTVYPGQRLRVPRAR